MSVNKGSNDAFTRVEGLEMVMERFFMAPRELVFTMFQRFGSASEFNSVFIILLYFHRNIPAKEYELIIQSFSLV